jgi:hypothetical protein
MSASSADRELSPAARRAGRGPTWKRTREGPYGLRYTLVGTSWYVVASGGRHVSGYGAHGRARLSGAERSFTLVGDGRRQATYDRLRDAKDSALRRLELAYKRARWTPGDRASEAADVAVRLALGCVCMVEESDGMEGVFGHSKSCPLYEDV